MTRIAIDLTNEERSALCWHAGTECLQSALRIIIADIKMKKYRSDHPEEFTAQGIEDAEDIIIHAAKILKARRDKKA